MPKLAYLAVVLSLVSHLAATSLQSPFSPRAERLPEAPLSFERLPGGEVSRKPLLNKNLLSRRAPQSANGNNNNNSNNGGGGTGGGGGGGGGNRDGFNADPQKSLCLVANQVSTGAQQDGQDKQEPNQVASATSVNNFINFCLTRSDLPLTNGAQVKTGSCNGIVMGVIAAQAKMPSSKFVNPSNLDTIPPNQSFTIQMKIENLITGNFVNAQENYFSAPQNTDDSGTIIGHSHVVIEEIDSLTSTDVTNPQVFAFFKGLNAPASNGVLSTDVTGGLPAGVYKMSSINTAANHQPALVGVAQHGSLDDAVYFTVSNDPGGGGGGGGGGNSNNNNGGNSALSSAQVSSSSANSVQSSSSSFSSSSSSFSSSSGSGGFKNRDKRRELEAHSGVSLFEREEEEPDRISFTPSRLEKRLQTLLDGESERDEE